MKRLALFSAILSLVCTAVWAQNRTYQKDIGDITELTVADNINVTVRHNPDSTGLAVFSCPGELAHVVTFSGKNGKIKVESVSDRDLPGGCPDVTIYVKTLRKVTNWGDSTITVVSNEWAEEFKAKVIGNGNIEVLDIDTRKLEGAVEAGKGRIYMSGRTKSAKYTIASAGAIEAGDVTSDKVKCSLFGTGDIDCHPTVELSVYGAGTGTVYYIGDPNVKKTGLGIHVKKLGE